MITRSHQSRGHKRKHGHQTNSVNTIKTDASVYHHVTQKDKGSLMFDPSFAPELIFSILDYDDDLFEWNTMEDVWSIVPRNTFLENWIHHSNMEGILFPLNRAEGGVCTANESRQLRFNRMIKNQICVRVRKGLWAIAELEKLMHGFIITMDTMFASIGDGATTNGQLQLIWDVGRDVNYQYDARVHLPVPIVCETVIQPLIRGFYSNAHENEFYLKPDQKIAQLPSHEEESSMSFVENVVKDKSIVALEYEYTQDTIATDFCHPNVRVLNQIVTGMGDHHHFSNVEEIWIFIIDYMNSTVQQAKSWIDDHVFRPTLDRIQIIRHELTKETTEFLPDVLVQLWMDYIVPCELIYHVTDITHVKSGDILSLPIHGDESIHTNEKVYHTI